jgi:hypothetical protein
MGPDIVVREGKAVIAIGDAKYKRVLEDPAADEEVALTVENVRFARSDLYQLYTYMRLAKAKRGFFVAPAWRPNERAAWLVECEFGERPPVKGAELRVLFLNLARPVREVLAEGAKELREFFAEVAPPPT